MRLVVIGHVQHKSKEGTYFGYAPYVREMNIWFNHVSEVEIVAPLVNDPISSIDASFEHPNITFNHIPTIEFTSPKTILKSLFATLLILLKIYQACMRADHIHVRCPGNIGLLGCLVQILFPKKQKTAKYAGNWDPNSKQPLSYRFQKKILKSTFLSKNIKVLVYGDFKDNNKNIKPFFTASFYENEIENLKTRNYNQALKFLFIGSLVKGKRPLLSLQIIENLINNGVEATIDFYGEGAESSFLKKYASEKNLDEVVKFRGNHLKEDIKEALKKAHFLLLPSKSEGWPKAVAEAMFFGAIPISTRISCIPYMLDEGKRGILISPEIKEATLEIMNHLKPNHLIELSENAVTWSQNYTLDAFEIEIKKLVTQ